MGMVAAACRQHPLRRFDECRRRDIGDQAGRAGMAGRDHVHAVRKRLPTGHVGAAIEDNHRRHHRCHEMCGTAFGTDVEIGKLAERQQDVTDIDTSDRGGIDKPQLRHALSQLSHIGTVAGVFT